MKILSLDPSSSATGWALADYDTERFLQAGFVTPEKRKAPVAFRADEMTNEISGLIREHAPTVVVVEAMTEKQYTRDPAIRSALPPCGWAMGWMGGWIDARYPDITVYPISNVEWTQGRGGKDRKAKRQIEAKLLMPDYDPARDTKDADMADAICLGAWWIRQQKGNDRLAAALRKGTR